MTFDLEANKSVVRRYFDVYAQRAPERLDEIITPDYRDFGHEPPGIGLEGARADYEGLVSGFDDIVYEVGDMVAEGDLVAVRWQARMTHARVMRGAPPTGRRVTFKGFSFYRLKNGRICATRNLQNIDDLRRQIEGKPVAGGDDG